MDGRTGERDSQTAVFDSGRRCPHGSSQRGGQDGILLDVVPKEQLARLADGDESMISIGWESVTLFVTMPGLGIIRRTVANFDSNRHPVRHPPRDSEQVGLHVDDLVVAVPLAQKTFFRRLAWNRTGQSMKQCWSARAPCQDEFKFQNEPCVGS